MWAVDNTKLTFINKKTGEVRAELYVVMADARPYRVLFGKDRGNPACRSEDAKSSCQGVACASCPQVSEVIVFNSYYEGHPDVPRPQYVGGCAFRYTIAWRRDFVTTQQGLVCFEHKERVGLSCPKTSVHALFAPKGYLSDLGQRGLRIKDVVTKIVARQRQDKTTKTTYAYADFEFAGMVKEMMGRVVKTVKVASGPSTVSLVGHDGRSDGVG